MTAQEKLDSKTVLDTNPATGTAVAELNETDLAKLPEIMSKAREAQAIWAAKSFKERARHITMMRSYIVDRADDLARTVSESNGKTLTDALATEVLPCALACKWYANNAEKYLKEKNRPGGSILFFNKKTHMLRVPLGVVGIISPWNYPLSIPFGEIVMGLMAGNAVLLKVAAATPAVGRAIEQIIAAGELPEGLFHHIVGSGSKVATGFFENGVDKLFFTGSVPAGKTLMAQAAETLTPVSLELGGNDPMLVLEDADLERATNGAAWAGYQNAGQSCGGVERVYVVDAVYDQFVDLLAKKTRQLRHGVGCKDFDVDIGSLTTAGQLRTVSIGKGQLFCLPQHLENFAADIFDRLHTEQILRGRDLDSFVTGLTELLGDINALHPFREGNGRTQRAFLAQLAHDAGYELRWTTMDPAGLPVEEEDAPARWVHATADQSVWEKLAQCSAGH